MHKAIEETLEMIKTLIEKLDTITKQPSEEDSDAPQTEHRQHGIRGPVPPDNEYGYVLGLYKQYPKEKELTYSETQQSWFDRGLLMLDEDGARLCVKNLRRYALLSAIYVDIHTTADGEFRHPYTNWEDMAVPKYCTFFNYETRKWVIKARHKVVTPGAFYFDSETKAVAFIEKVNQITD